MRILSALFAVFILTSGTLLSQVDAHYWTHQYGAQGLLLNGAVIANTQGETALFYNPGAIGMASQGFELSFVTPNYSQLKTNNLLGEDNEILGRRLDNGSGFVGVTFKPRKEKKVTFGISTFQRYRTDISFEERVILPINQAQTLFLRGDLDFERKLSEHWVGLSMAYNITEGLGIGVTQFSTFHNQDTRFNFKREIISSLEPDEIVQSWRSEFDYGLNVYSGFITKLGLAYRAHWIRLGLTYTSPEYGAIRRTGSYALEDQRINVLTNTNQTVSNRNNNISIQKKSPASYGFGIDLLTDSGTYSFSAEYFSEIPRYVTLQDTDDPFDAQVNTDLPTVVEIIEGNNSVFNFAVGAQQEISENTTIIFGFRTDLDPSNRIAINELPEYLGTVGNVFHLSGGGLFKRGKNNFSLGIDFGYGRKPGGQQLANFSNIDQNSLFEQRGEPIVTSTFFSAMIFCTYDFIFSSMEPIDEKSDTNY